MQGHLIIIYVYVTYRNFVINLKSSLIIFFMNIELLLSCPHGMEDLLVEELEEQGYYAAILKPSKVIVRDANLEAIPYLNFNIRQMHRVYLILKRGCVDTLEQLREQAGTIDFTEFMHSNQSFAVRGVREGNHHFTSVDMSREVGSAVTECFLKKQNTRVHADLDKPEIEFTVELSDQDFIISINTTGESQHRRDRSKFQHFAPLKASIAASLIRVSSFGTRGNLLDPMAGGGTIPAEAYMMAANIPPGILNTDFAFNQLNFINQEKWSEKRQNLINNIRKDVLVSIGAADKYHKNVMGMKKNLENHKVTIYRGDARKLNYYKPGLYDLVVCNPPYGLRVGDKQHTKELYEDFAVACAQNEIREVVALTPLHVFWERSFTKNGFRLIKKQRVLYGRLNCYILKMELK